MPMIKGSCDASESVDVVYFCKGAIMSAANISSSLTLFFNFLMFKPNQSSVDPQFLAKCLAFSILKLLVHLYTHPGKQFIRRLYCFRFLSCRNWCHLGHSHIILFCSAWQELVLFFFHYSALSGAFFHLLRIIHAVK